MPKKSRRSRRSPKSAEDSSDDDDVDIPASTPNSRAISRAANRTLLASTVTHASRAAAVELFAKLAYEIAFPSKMSSIVQTPAKVQPGKVSAAKKAVLGIIGGSSKLGSITPTKIQHASAVETPEKQPSPIPVTKKRMLSELDTSLESASGIERKNVVKASSASTPTTPTRHLRSSDKKTAGSQMHSPESGSSSGSGIYLRLSSEKFLRAIKGLADRQSISNVAQSFEDLSSPDLSDASNLAASFGLSPDVVQADKQAGSRKVEGMVQTSGSLKRGRFEVFDVFVEKERPAKKLLVRFVSKRSATL